MMDLITGLKSLWPDFKISVNDLQQPSTQLIVNFVKRSVEELGKLFPAIFSNRSLMKNFKNSIILIKKGSYS